MFGDRSETEEIGDVDFFSRVYEKENELIRAAMVHLFSGVVPLYIVNEFPKSGGTWVGQMMGRALGIPFPRNRFPMFRTSIMHGHYLNPWGMRNVVVPWRDGRDVIVSWYHQQLISHEWNQRQVERSRREFPLENYEDVYENLPAFIEYAFTRWHPTSIPWADFARPFTSPHAPNFSWVDFVHSWHERKGVVHVRYEELRQDAARELRRIIFELTGRQLSPEEAAAVAEEFSFERQTGRRPGEENKRSFLRKGVVGDWRNHFSPEARRTFDRYAGDELILLGYERDRSWVTDK